MRWFIVGLRRRCSFSRPLSGMGSKTAKRANRVWVYGHRSLENFESKSIWRRIPFVKSQQFISAELDTAQYDVYIYEVLWQNQTDDQSIQCSVLRLIKSEIYDNDSEWSSFQDQHLSRSCEILNRFVVHAWPPSLENRILIIQLFS